MATIRPHALARVTSVDADDTIIVDRASSTPRSVKLTDALNSTDLSNAKVKETDMFNPAGVGGKTDAFPLVAYVKGEIKFTEQYSPVLGEGISAPDAASNASKLYYAGIECGNRRRPLSLPRGGKLTINATVPFGTNYTEVYGNGCEVIHDSSVAQTVFSFNGASGANRIVKPKLYDIIINAKGHLKSATFYALQGTYHDNAHFENIEIRDPFNTAWLISDPYNLTAPWPAMTSNDLTMRNIKVTRSAANIAAIAGKPAMMQGDQAVVTGVSGYKLENISAYYSGRSGLSLGLCENGYLRGFDGDSCQAGIYIETIKNSQVSQFHIRNHMHQDGVTGSVDTHGIFVTTADETLSGTGYGTALNLQIFDGIIRDITRAGGAGVFHGVHVSGRNGSNLAQAISIQNVIGQNISGGAAAGLLTFDGELYGCHATNIIARACGFGYRADRSYTAPGGAAANKQTHCWVDGLHVSGTTAAVDANSAGGTHVTSGVRNSTFGGGTTAFTGTLTNHTTNTA